MRRWSLSAIIFPLRFEGWAIRWFLEMAANIGTAEWHVFFLSFSPIAQRTPNRTSQRAQTHAHRQRRQWPSIIYRIRVSHHKLISTQNVIATSIVRTHWQRTHRHRELPAKPAKKTSTLDCRKCVFFRPLTLSHSLECDSYGKPKNCWNAIMVLAHSLTPAWRPAHRRMQCVIKECFN